MQSIMSEGKWYQYAVLKKYGEEMKLVIMKGLLYQQRRIKRGVKKGSVNEEKLENNIIRAKTAIREYGLCNDWEYWVTLTIKNERNDLEGWRKRLTAWLRRKKQEGQKIDYLLVPERHKDGNWHMHGLFQGIKEEWLEINENGYKDWPEYRKKFGYISMSKIKDGGKAVSYLTKYLVKDKARLVEEIGKRMFYRSQGLKRAEVVKKGSYYENKNRKGYETEYAIVEWMTSAEAEEIKGNFF